MISRAPPSFWRAYGKLKQFDQDSARRVFRLFLANPAHNSLQFKKLRGHANLWSVRVTLDVRAVGYREGDIIEWLLARHSLGEGRVADPISSIETRSLPAPARCYPFAFYASHAIASAKAGR